MKPETLRSVQEHIKTASDKIREMSDDIAKAKKAGIDVTEQERILTDLSNKTALLRSVYKP